MKMTFYAVFDTNVFVSALLSRRADSPTVCLLDYVLDGRIILLYDEEILSEYDDVLHRSKFDFSDDRVFYEVALSKDGAYIVTGNLRHFPKTPIVNSFSLIGINILSLMMIDIYPN